MPERAHRPSIAQELDQATTELAHAGVLNPRQEARALWAAVEGLKPGDVWLKRDGTPITPVARRFWEAVGRRSSGIPFPYAIGRAAFRTLELKLDPRALIPRPETEGLVELVLEWAGARDAGGGMRDAGSGMRDAEGVAADIGTGCGCIALALAVEGKFERVVAVERSADAAALARENVELVRPPVPVDVREGDLLEPLGDARYRVIVSNPPYLTTDEYERLPAVVRQFEPREALVSGADGLAATRAVLTRAAAWLEPSGLLALEIDERRADQVRALAHEYGWARVGIHHDLFGRPRYALAFPAAARGGP